MKPTAVMKTLCLLLVLAGSTAALAEDIDLFAGATNVALPNLIIVVDNTANWGNQFPAPIGPRDCGGSNSTRYCSVKTALYNTVNSLNTANGAKVNLGLMLFNYNAGKANPALAPTTNMTGNSDGAFVRFAVRPMDSAGKSALLNVIDGLFRTSDQGTGGAQNAMSLEEARRYLGGLPVLNGNNTFYQSSGGPQVLDLSATDATHATYKSPAIDACQASFILYISNGPPATADDSPASTALAALNGGVLPAVIPFPATVPNQWQSNWMDEYSHLLFQRDNVPGLTGTQYAVTYGITLRDPNWNVDNQNSSVSARYLVKNAALQGGGKYCDATSSASLQECLSRMFAEIQAVNSVFVSATLPVALNISNTYLNQVYMGLFRPDAKLNPRWFGNLKEYQLAYDADNQGLTLVDRNGDPAVSAKTGFIVPTAWSRWTHNPTTGVQGGAGSVDFWRNSVRGSPVPTATDGPDGEVVEKGGAAQSIREAYLINAPITGSAGSADRKVLTCALNSTCAAACTGTPANFDLSNISASNSNCQAKFGATNATDMQDLVNWIRGVDNKGDESGPGQTSTNFNVTIRGSVHGDVLHSRPQIVNYGGATGIVAYYGGNDGMLHAVCAGVGGDSCAGGKSAGQELWTFVAPETYGKFKRLREQSPLVWMPNVDYSAAPTAPQRRDYFIDGGIGVYRTSGRTVLYVTARRGGNFIYAIDVTTPTAPKLLWKIDNTTTGFTNLAQTWSTPQVGYVRARGKSNPVLVFGAGYCGGYSGSSNGKPTGVGEDSDAAATSAPSCPATADGRGVYVVDLGNNAESTTPTVLKFFQATWTNAASIGSSVAADVTLLDRDGDGYVDRAYAADMGGSVWRMDLDDASTTNWKLFKFAVAKQLADGSGQREKFLFRPDVVPTRAFDAVLLGSGDREDPLSTTTNNRFYMFKDFKTGKDASTSPAMTTISDYSKLLNAATASPEQLRAAVSDSANSGWYYPLLTDGEKVVNAPLTIAGTVYFSTNRPNAALPPDLSCSNLGEARAYRVNFAAGTAAGPTASTMYTGGGLPPSPTAGVVQVGSALVPFCIGCGPGADIPIGVPVSGMSPIAPIKIFVNPPTTRKKTFWYSNTDQ